MSPVTALTSCRAPRHGPSLHRQRGLWHESCGRSRCEHGVLPFRGDQPHDVWRLPRDDARHARGALTPSCGESGGRPLARAMKARKSNIRSSTPTCRSRGNGFCIPQAPPALTSLPRQFEAILASARGRSACSCRSRGGKVRLRPL